MVHFQRLTLNLESIAVFVLTYVYLYAYLIKHIILQGVKYGLMYDPILESIHSHPKSSETKVVTSEGFCDECVYCKRLSLLPDP